MNINKLIKEAHENAVDKGFYSCPECGCSGKVNYIGINDDCDKKYDCSLCNGTGIDQNKNIPELLMLVITEISKAVEALREGKRSDSNQLNRCITSIKNNAKTSFIVDFNMFVKDAFEDEIADVFIRLFDLCGYLKIEIDESEYVGLDCAQNKSEALFDIIEMIVELRKKIKNYNISIDLPFAFFDIFKHLEYFCECNKIDIEKHITAKMQYNKTRSKKHGKEF